MSALEDLVRQESVALRTADFSAAETIQERIAALIEGLVALGAEVLDPALRARVQTLQSDRAATSERLEKELAKAREELHATHAARRQVAKVAPVYRAKLAPAHTASQLRYVG